MYKTDIINILYERNEKNDKYFTDFSRYSGKQSNRFGQYASYDFDLGCYYCFYVFLSPLFVMGRLPPRCRQVKNMAFVITIIPHLQWFLLLSLVFQPSISFRIMSS